MVRKIEDFVNDWKSEQESTINVFSKIPDANLSQKVAENIRSLGRLAWHITQTVTEMPQKAGIVDKDVLEDKPAPTSMNEILDAYKKHSTELVELLTERWTDCDLPQMIEVYGQQWEKRKILSALINHQIHHRAQMTVLMRMQGIYGPSQEEWVQYGMDSARLTVADNADSSAPLFGR